MVKKYVYSGLSIMLGVFLARIGLNFVSEESFFYGWYDAVQSAAVIFLFYILYFYLRRSKKWISKRNGSNN